MSDETVQTAGDEAAMKEFIESTDAPEGLTEAEGATILEEKLKRGDVTDHKRDKRAGDPEKAKEAKKRLQDSGEFEDAVDVLEEGVKLDEADAPEGEETESEDDTPSGLTLDDVSEKLGVDPAEIVGTVKVDGETFDVTLAEMAEGFQRESDYTKKTQRLSQKRKEYEESLREAEALRAQAQQTLSFLAEATENELTPHQRQRLRQTLQQVQQERAAINARIQQEVLPVEEARLAEKIGADSEEDLQQAKEMIGDAAVEHYGFQPNELAHVRDHRLVAMAWDAARYRQLKNEVGEVGENIGRGDAQPTLKPGQGRARRSRSSRRQAELNEKLSQTGSAKAAAELLQAMDAVE